MYATITTEKGKVTRVKNHPEFKDAIEDGITQAREMGLCEKELVHLAEVCDGEFTNAGVQVVQCTE